MNLNCASARARGAISSSQKGVGVAEILLAVRRLGTDDEFRTPGRGSSGGERIQIAVLLTAKGLIEDDK